MSTIENQTEPEEKIDQVEQSSERRLILHGIAASPGLSFGPVFLLERKALEITKRSLSAAEIEKEIERVHIALGRSEKELGKILSFTEQKIGNDKAKIFEAQILMLQDQTLIDQIIKHIRKGKVNAEFAVHTEMTKYLEMLLRSDEEYMRERTEDLDDIKNRIIRNIQQERLISKFEGRVIVVAKNLTPADTILFSRNDVLGYATDMGGITSHTALLSRALNIPAVVGLTNVSKSVQNGDEIVLDGYSGTVIVRPSKEDFKKYEEKKQRYKLFEKKLTVLRELPAETADGKRIILAANAEMEEELDFVGFQGAEGIGLYRSESLLIGRDTFPDEEEQYDAYWFAAQKVYPHDILIRVFDIGGDKIFPKMVEESNPFLGWRGIRILIDRPEIFKTQVRAILRASKKKNVKILLPMISGVNEVQESLRIIGEVKQELKENKVKFDENIQTGSMIEVPSAAILSREISRLVDFVSIGTNDLIQYLLAVDRGNPTITKLFQEFHPAVLRMVKHSIDGGHKMRVWVGMCGEMAGDPLATILLVGMGIDELSVVPSVLPEIKKIIRSVNYKDAQKIARRALSMETPEEVYTYMKNTLKSKLPDVPIG